MADRFLFLFFFSSRRRHTRFDCDWSSDVCSSDLFTGGTLLEVRLPEGAELTRDNIAAVLPPDFQLATLQQSGANQFQLKGNELSNAARQSLLAGLQAQFTSVEVLRSETIG